MINWTGGHIHISYFIAQIQPLHKKEIFRKILDWVDERLRVLGVQKASIHISSAMISLVFFHLISSYLGVSIDAVCIPCAGNKCAFYIHDSSRVGRAAADAEMHIRSPSDRRGKGRRKGRKEGGLHLIWGPTDLSLLYPSSHLNKNFRPIWKEISRAG